MIDDCLSGSRMIGIIQPDGRDEDDDGESPQGRSVGLRRIGCAGRITSYQEMDDGRIVITLTGIARFEIRDESHQASPTAW